MRRHQITSIISHALGAPERHTESQHQEEPGSQQPPPISAARTASREGPGSSDPLPTPRGSRHEIRETPRYPRDPPVSAGVAGLCGAPRPPPSTGSAVQGAATLGDRCRRSSLPAARLAAAGAGGSSSPAGQASAARSPARGHSAAPSAPHSGRSTRNRGSSEAKEHRHDPQWWCGGCTVPAPRDEGRDGGRLPEWPARCPWGAAGPSCAGPPGW